MQWTSIWCDLFGCEVVVLHPSLLELGNNYLSVAGRAEVPTPGDEMRRQPAERSIRFMEHVDALVLQVQLAPDGDDEELAELTRRLRTHLLDLDVDSVDPVADTSAPEGAKGLETLIGWLAVRFGKEGLRTVVAAVASWATRTGHDVDITYGGDTLKVSGVTSEQQERVINDFLAHHAPRP